MDAEDKRIQRAMRDWNTGHTAAECKKTFGLDVEDLFDRFEQAVGDRSFTMAEIHYARIGATYPRVDRSSLEPEEPDWYRAWKGEIGPGAQLKEIIKEHNATARAPQQ